ncbi:histidine kinase [Salegentibacter sp. JZCK2]|uniref:sensor histidine kinase n=1 Tax=Salegentibacter tibetensis TaxID=2873600 RepID=UPI001CCE71A4|nr:histidine kinase [Salegentibacter tibetensis]MBZ9730576.1 histidine kinase [Salegentibacter tibetensis]
MSLSALKNKYIDVKLILLLAAFYTLFNLVYIGKLAYMRVFVYKEIMESWHDIIFHNLLIDWIIVVTYMTLIAISTKRLLNKNYSWTRIFLLHTLLSILIGFVIRFFFDLHGILLGRMNFADYSVKASIDRMIFVIDLNFLIYFAMIFIIYTYYYLKQVKEAEKQKTQLESQLTNTRMKMLSSQLQPHFLFNTLNSISVLVELDAKKAQDTIADLSDLLREILYSGENYKVSLRKELRMLDYYLNILTLRFSDHLKVEKNIDESLLDHVVPSLILQPIIENSVKHGYSYHNIHLKIEINIFKEKNYLVLSVYNNGKSLTEKQEALLNKGVGISNIRDRLFTFYGEKAQFKIRNIEAGVETLIKIPFSKT